MVISAVALAAFTAAASACASGTVPATRPAGGAVNGQANAAGKAGGTVKAAGVSAMPASTGHSAVTTSVPKGMVKTEAQARKVYDFYVIRTANMLAKHRMNSAIVQTQGVARDELTTAITTAAFDHTKLKPYQYGNPTFYIPTLSVYPDWFVVSVKRTAPADSFLPDLAGMPQAASGQELLFFQKTNKGRNWQLSADVQLLPGQSPQIASTNAYGGAEAEPINDQTAYLARPDVVGPLQAAVADEGPTAPASQAVAAGPLTTGIYQQEADANPGTANTGQWTLQSAHANRVALRTTNGGVLVLYPGYLNTAQSGKALSVPDGFLPLLPTKTAGKPLSHLNTQTMMTFAAIDPPASDPNAKIQVIGIGGAPDQATGS